LTFSKLAEYLKAGPIVTGFETDLWTCRRVEKLIQDKFGVEYHHCHVWKILQSLGWTCQKLERLARERDEDAILTWRQQRWPAIKKARRRNATIVFIDESGFMLQPVVRRTWAPRGETPILKSWDRWNVYRWAETNLVQRWSRRINANTLRRTRPNSIRQSMPVRQPSAVT